jgi:hypothetical protein
VIFMRRLAILFAILAAISGIEHIALSRAATRIIQAPSRICRALVRLSNWRAYLSGPIRLFQRVTSRGAGPWLGLSN